MMFLEKVPQMEWALKEPSTITRGRESTEIVKSSMSEFWCDQVKFTHSQNTLLVKGSGSSGGGAKPRKHTMATTMKIGQDTGQNKL